MATGHPRNHRRLTRACSNFSDQRGTPSNQFDVNLKKKMYGVLLKQEFSIRKKDRESFFFLKTVFDHTN